MELGYDVGNPGHRTLVSQPRRGHWDVATPTNRASLIRYGPALQPLLDSGMCVGIGRALSRRRSAADNVVVETRSCSDRGAPSATIRVGGRRSATWDSWGAVGGVRSAAGGNAAPRSARRFYSGPLMRRWSSRLRGVSFALLLSANHRPIWAGLFHR